MVRLERLVMQNFKSFAGKVAIPFPKNLSIICGPNGSGKSNLIDAITFVIGTPRAKDIRADKLKNLVFNGGKSRSPAEWCEVSLYLDNSDGRISGEKELKIARRVTRSGVSIFKLNGRTVNRSKIIDLLASGSISPEGYNIIMQGDVSRVIEMTPMERREIIEDISGISEFDDKKEKANREFIRIETRLREMTLLVADRRGRITRLKEEKERAEKFLKLEKDLKKARASLYKRRLDETSKKLDTLNEGIEKNDAEFKKLDADVSVKELEYEKIEQDLQNKIGEMTSKGIGTELYRKIESIRNEIFSRKEKLAKNQLELERSGTSNRVVKEVMKLKKEGVHGTVSGIVKIPAKYAIAIDVAIGRHKDDIIVSTNETAVSCIKYLKQHRSGRARFLPLDKIRGKGKDRLPENAIGFAIDLIEFSRKYTPAMEYVLGSTIVVTDIDIGKDITDYRIVTLDGDLMERSGAMIGGFYEKAGHNAPNVDKIMKENERMEKEIEELERHTDNLENQREEEGKALANLRTQIGNVEKRLQTVRAERQKESSIRNELMKIINEMKIEKARVEARIADSEEKMRDFADVTEFYTIPDEEIQEKIRNLQIEMGKIGPVNLKAIDDYQAENVEFEDMSKKLDVIVNEKNAIVKTIEEIEKKRYEKFMTTLQDVSKSFNKIYFDLMGGNADLSLEEENNIDSGLVIEANPAGKKILNLDVMSGGEKTVTSLAFLFAIQQLHAAPFYVLDEIDAALDKVNTKNIAGLLKKYSSIQFIVITHNDITIAVGDNVYGVSMEDGVSKVFTLEMPND